MATLSVGGGNNDIRAFGAGTGSRAAGNAYYQLDFGPGYLAAAFDITAFESSLPPFDIPASAVGPGTVEITFADADVETFMVSGGDGSNIFFGFTADSAVTRIRWLEALEVSGVNEETAFGQPARGLAREHRARALELAAGRRSAGAAGATPPLRRRTPRDQQRGFAFGSMPTRGRLHRGGPRQQ